MALQDLQLPDACVHYDVRWLPAPDADALLHELTLAIAWETHRIRLFGRDVRTIATSELADLIDVSLSLPRLEGLTAAAHAASRELPADPTAAAPPDTTRIATTGGPC